MAGLIQILDGTFIISDGSRQFEFPLSHMHNFREVGLSDLEDTTSGDQRYAEIDNSNVRIYFGKPDETGNVGISFVFGKADDLEITVTVSGKQLIRICFAIPPKE